MGRRPPWATGPTKKQIQAALNFYAPRVTKDEVRGILRRDKKSAIDNPANRRKISRVDRAGETSL